MRIALVYNLRPSSKDRNDPTLEKSIEGDEWKTVEAIGEAIKSNGHRVKYFPISHDIYEDLKKSKRSIDLIFNLSEGIRDGVDREAQLPMVAQILGIPHTGPTPLSSALILNKSRAKEIWKANGILTAQWQLFNSVSTPLEKSLSYPLIVKPNSEGSGIGIKKKSIVNNSKELKSAAKVIIDEYHNEALVEEYLNGREFTVAIIGNGKDIQALPIVEINFDAFPQGAPRIDTYEAKFVYGVTGQATETEWCPAKINKKLESEIKTAAINAYRSIGCYDFGRVDIRLDSKGRVNVIEINHPPGLMSDPNESSFFTISGRANGWDFNKLIGKIIESAIKRLKLKS